MRPLRSFLFVPADSERKYTKARDSGADAIILDLEDSVALEAKAVARSNLAGFLSGSCEAQRWVRVNPLDNDFIDEDLASLAELRPDGLVLPKSSSVASLQQLRKHLATPLPVLAIATETAGSLFEMGSYRTGADGLYGLTWGAEDLSTALGALSKFREDGIYEDVYRLARSLCLAGARAAGVQPVDGIYADFRDIDGLAVEARAAYLAGFTGKLAIHPAQVPVINECFTPNAEEIDYAQRVVAAFEAAGGAGVVGLDGRMLDRPHLLRAQEILEVTAGSS